MELKRSADTQRQIEAVLWRDEDPIKKVQQLIDLGLPEEVADSLVERYQIGQSNVVYYEQLPLGHPEDL